MSMVPCGALSIHDILANFIHGTHASHASIFMCQVKKVCELSEPSGQGRAQIPLEEFGRVLRRFSTLAAPDAVELIDEVAWQSRVLTSDALRWKTEQMYRSDSCPDLTLPKAS